MPYDARLESEFHLVWTIRMAETIVIAFKLTKIKMKMVFGDFDDIF